MDLDGDPYSNSASSSRSLHLLESLEFTAEYKESNGACGPCNSRLPDSSEYRAANVASRSGADSPGRSHLPDESKFSAGYVANDAYRPSSSGFPENSELRAENVARNGACSPCSSRLPESSEFRAEYVTSSSMFSVRNGACYFPRSSCITNNPEFRAEYTASSRAFSPRSSRLLESLKFTAEYKKSNGVFTPRNSCLPESSEFRVQHVASSRGAGSPERSHLPEESELCARYGACRPCSSGLLDSSQLRAENVVRNGACSPRRNGTCSPCSSRLPKSSEFRADYGPSKAACSPRSSRLPESSTFSIRKGACSPSSSRSPESLQFTAEYKKSNGACSPRKSLSPESSEYRTEYVARRSGAGSSGRSRLPEESEFSAGYVADDVCKPCSSGLLESSESRAVYITSHGACNPCNSCLPDFGAGYVAFDGNCLLPMTMQALVICNSQLYLLSDAEKVGLDIQDGGGETDVLYNRDKVDLGTEDGRGEIPLFIYDTEKKGSGTQEEGRELHLLICDSENIGLGTQHEGKELPLLMYDTEKIHQGTHDNGKELPLLVYDTEKIGLNGQNDREEVPLIRSDTEKISLGGQEERKDLPLLMYDTEKIGLVRQYKDKEIPLLTCDKEKIGLDTQEEGKELMFHRYDTDLGIEDERIYIPTLAYDRHDDNCAKRRNREVIEDYFSKSSSQNPSSSTEQRDCLKTDAAVETHPSCVDKALSSLCIGPTRSEKELRNQIYCNRTNSQRVNHFTNTAKHRNPQKVFSPKNITMKNIWEEASNMKLVDSTKKDKFIHNREDSENKDDEKIMKLVASPKKIILKNYSEDSNNSTDEDEKLVSSINKIVSIIEDSNNNTYEEKKKVTQEKWTYCRPVLNQYSREDRFKYFNKVNKLQGIVKRIAEAREREKEQIARTNYINKMRNKYKINELGTNPEPQPPSIDWGTNPEPIEDYYKTIFMSSNYKRCKATKSERCKALLQDVIEYNPLCCMQPSCFDQNTDNFTMTNDFNSSPTNSLFDTSCYPLHLLRKPMNCCNEINNAEVSTKFDIDFRTNIVTQRKLFSNKSMCFPTSSLTMLQSETKQEDRTDPEIIPKNYKTGFKINASIIKISENKSMFIETPISYKNDQSTDVDTLIRNHLNDHKSRNFETNVQKNRIIGERTHIQSRNAIFTSIIQTCDADVNTETVKNHKWKDYGLKLQVQDQVSILKNSSCDESTNTDAALSKQDYARQASKLFENETICYLTASKKASTHKDKKDVHPHGHKKWDRQRPRIILRKTKAIVKKFKTKFRSTATQTEKRFFFGSIRRNVRYKEDPKKMKSDEEKVNSGKRSDSNVSEKQFLLNPLRRESSNQFLLQGEENANYLDNEDTKKSLLKRASRPNLMDNRESIDDEIDKSKERKEKTSTDSKDPSKASRKIGNAKPGKYSNKPYIAQMTAPTIKPAVNDAKLAAATGFDKSKSPQRAQTPSKASRQQSNKGYQPTGQTPATDSSPQHTNSQQSNKGKQPMAQPSSNASPPQHTNRKQSNKGKQMPSRDSSPQHNNSQQSNKGKQTPSRDSSPQNTNSQQSNTGNQPTAQPSSNASPPQHTNSQQSNKGKQTPPRDSSPQNTTRQQSNKGKQTPPRGSSPHHSNSQQSNKGKQTPPRGSSPQDTNSQHSNKRKPSMVPPPSDDSPLQRTSSQLSNKGKQPMAQTPTRESPQPDTNSQQSKKGHKTTTKEEYEKVAENVARLKSRNEDRSNNSFYKGLDGKVDLLINAVNLLVSQLKEKNTNSTLPNLPKLNNCGTDCPALNCNNSDTNIDERVDTVPKRLCDVSLCKSKACISRQSYSPLQDVSQTYRKHNGISGIQTHVVNTLCLENNAFPMHSNYLETDMGKIAQDQMKNFNKVKPNKNTIYCMSSNRNIKIEQILLEELGKSDQAKKDIEDILNGEFHSQALQVAVEIPTRELATEITASLSKTKVIESDTQTFVDDYIINSPSSAHGKIHCAHICSYNNLNKMRKQNFRNVSIQEQRCLTITLDSIPLGILGLFRISTQTIGRILNFMHGRYNECMSLLPMYARQLDNPTQYVCNLCKAVFRRSSEYAAHLRDEHREPSVRDCCVCCHLVEAQAVRSVVSRVGLFACRHCGQPFTRSYCCELHQQACARRLGLQPSISDGLAILR